VKHIKVIYILYDHTAVFFISFVNMVLPYAFNNTTSLVPRYIKF